MKIFEKFLSFVSPKYALERKKNEIKINMLERSYLAASKSQRLQYWLADNSSVNMDTYKSLDILRARSRDLVKNDGYAHRAITAIQTNAVGTGITADITRNGKPDNQVQELWNNFADSTYCDAEGKLNFSGLQSLLMREVAESGECFVRKFPRKYTKGEIPFELKLLEPDLIDSQKDTSSLEHDLNSDIIYQGIKFNNRGKRLGYYLKNNYENMFTESKYIDAKDILHCLRIDRTSQARGIPWLSPVLLDLKNLSDYQDSELIRRKIASCYAAFVHDIDGTNVGDDHAAEGEDARDLQGETITAGTIEMLPAGKTVTLATPPSVSGYEEYNRSILKKIAVGVGVSYEVLTSDLSQVNFSSGRMGWLEFQRNLEHWRWNILIPMFCNPVFNWFLSSINEVYGISLNGIKVDWTPPRREMIDPLKEVKADMLSVRNGFKSLDEIHRENGYNSNAILQKIAHITKELHKLGITLDCDPKETTQSGILNNIKKGGKKIKNDK
jgi:lambda family phage portal protein